MYEEIKVVNGMVSFDAYKNIEQDRDNWKARYEGLRALCEELIGNINKNHNILYSFSCGDNPCVMCRIKKELEKEAR